MSDDLVEKVARALYLDSAREAPNVMTWDEFVAYQGDDYEGVKRFRSRARAALRVVREALAEPDLDMLRDGNHAARKARRSGVSGMTLDAQINAECARENACWRAMLAASPLGRVE